MASSLGSGGFIRPIPLCMTQATVSESCKGLHNALTNAIARRLPLGIARPLRIVRVRTYQMRNGDRSPIDRSAIPLQINLGTLLEAVWNGLRAYPRVVRRYRDTVGCQVVPASAVRQIR